MVGLPLEQVFNASVIAIHGSDHQGREEVEGVGEVECRPVFYEILD